MSNNEELKILEMKVLEPPIAVGSFHVVLPLLAWLRLFLGPLAGID